MADPAEPPLFLHEVIDIVGRGGAAYMAHTRDFDAGGAAAGGLDLVGTWEVVGTTGRWPQVVNIWEIDGWDGWARLAQRTNVAKRDNAELAEWWDEAYKRRTGGFDRVLRGAPGCPTRTTLAADGVGGSWFVHELSEVRPGAGPEYLARTLAERVPAMAERGIALVGLYDSIFTDTEVCTVWATTVAAHTALLRDGDPWPTVAREYCTRWREELMTPGEGTALARPEEPA
ncbi:MAG: NIPSNAP family containing protein [Actinomycetota bacterium]|nr:NIPSNAP family containing protein [Actinomycetota bacterium]